MPFDPLRALRVLNAHGVRYVIAGGFAGQVLGAPLTTQDLDICYERSRENLERLVDALVELGARLRVAKVEEDLPFILDAETLAKGDCFTFATDAGALDILGTPAGTSGYRDLSTGAQNFRIAPDLEVPVVDLPALIRMKEASGRPKDRLQLVTLLAVLEEIESSGSDSS